MRRRAHIKNTVFHHWKSSVFSLGLGVYDFIHNLGDPTSLTWSELGLRALKGAAIAGLGVFGRYGIEQASEAPRDERRDVE